MYLLKQIFGIDTCNLYIFTIPNLIIERDLLKSGSYTLVCHQNHLWEHVKNIAVRAPI